MKKGSDFFSNLQTWEEAMQSIEKKIKRLPPELKNEVEDFIDFLIEKKKKKPSEKLRLDWAGALKNIRDKYTSVELQHKISEWRMENELNRH